MLPIGVASSSLFGRLSRFGLLVLLSAVAVQRSEARPLAPWAIEDFRALIDSKRDSSLTEPSKPAVLAERRRKLREAAADLPSLGAVSRALLLSEWGSADLGIESSVPLDQIREAMKQTPDEAFTKKVRDLMRAYPEDRGGVSRAIVAEIKRDVRLRLLDRLEERMRFYLRSRLPADRIAAANLLSETLIGSRRQYVGIMADKAKDTAPTARYLRRRLRDLKGDVEHLLGDANLQVRTAGIRALSNLEIDSPLLVADLKPLLTSPRVPVEVRRAAAEALTNALDVEYTQWEKEKSRLQPSLKSVEHILPLAVSGLSDEDARVRRASLAACQRAAQLLDELVRDPLSPTDRRALFRPVVAVVDASLPAINARAHDSVPALRIAACRVLETLALAALRVRYMNEKPSLSPLPGPPAPKLPPPDNKRGASLPTPHGGRRSGIVRARWASDRPLSVPNTTPTQERDEAGSVVTLAPPVVLDDERIVIRKVVFEAPHLDELHPPRADDVYRGTVNAMRKNLSDKDFRVRLAAVDVLETLMEHAEPAIPDLVKALGDHNKFVRWASARTLGRLNPRKADIVVRGLQGLLNDREDPSVRIAAADALRLYGPSAKDAVPHLARVINRGDKEYILAILQTLQGIGTDAAPALPNVAWVLRDRSQPSVVRIEAARTLGRFGALAKEQRSVLREIMVNDADEAVRNAASMAVLGIDRPALK